MNCMPACSKVHAGPLLTTPLTNVTQAMCLHSWSLSSEFALRHAAKVQSANSAGKYLLTCCLVPVICVIVRRKALA